MKPNVIHALFALLVAFVVSAGYAEAKSYRNDTTTRAGVTAGQVYHRHHHHRHHHHRHFWHHRG